MPATATYPLMRGLNAARLIRNRLGHLVRMPSPRPFVQGAAGSPSLVNALSLSDPNDNVFTISASTGSLSIAYNGATSYPGASQAVQSRFSFYRPAGSSGILAASLSGSFSSTDPSAGITLSFSDFSAIDLPASVLPSAYLPDSDLYQSLPAAYSGQLPWYRFSCFVKLSLSLAPGASVTANFTVT